MIIQKGQWDFCNSSRGPTNIKTTKHERAIVHDVILDRVATSDFVQLPSEIAFIHVGQKDPSTPDKVEKHLSQ